MSFVEIKAYIKERTIAKDYVRVAYTATYGKIINYISMKRPQHTIS